MAKDPDNGKDVCFTAGKCFDDNWFSEGNCFDEDGLCKEGFLNL